MPSPRKLSAGLLVYRRRPHLEVLLVHPGGPFFARKDDGAWSIPKGEVAPEEDLLSAARREVTEETGYVASGPFIELGPVRQKGGKLIRAWACEGDLEPGAIVSNTFSIEWPPRSGRRAEFPEVDRAAFFDLQTARRKLNAAQVLLLDELAGKLGALDF
jgi:predicted NUDIX family NTP pyrophosphohydrolase